MKRHMLVLFLIVCIVANTLMTVGSVSAVDEYLDRPLKVGDIELDWRGPYYAGLITVREDGIRQSICTYVVSYDSFNDPTVFASILV